MKTFAQFVTILTFCLLGNTLAAPNVMFTDTENEPELGIEATTYLPESFVFKSEDTTSNSFILPNPTSKPEVEEDKTSAGFFPTEVVTDGNSESDNNGGPKAPENIIPAGIPGDGGETEGRTFHHLAQLHYKIDEKVSHLLYKLLSPFVQYEEPHYFQQSPYYRNSKLYRQDGYYNLESPLRRMFKPLTTIPQYFINHPINFKQGLDNIHHSIGKRSIQEENPENEARFLPYNRQPKTLHQIIPNFEQNFGALMKRVFGPLYGSNNQQIYADGPYKSTELAKPTITYTSFMRMLPQILERMSNVIKVPQFFRTPVINHH